MALHVILILLAVLKGSKCTVPDKYRNSKVHYRLGAMLAQLVMLEIFAFIIRSV